MHWFAVKKLLSVPRSQDDASRIVGKTNWQLLQSAMKKRERTSSKGFPYNTDFTRATALELGGKPPSASLVYATRLGAVLRFVNTSQLLFDCVVLRRRRCFIVVFCRPLHYRFGLVGDFYFVLCRFFICSAHTHSVRLNHSQCIFNHYVHQDIVVTFLTLCQSYTH